MGCPIRSEIWACIAPGAPRLAVRYAYEDAICDHAGGESVYGEFFNTAIESAAFVEKNVERLLDIGRSYVPDGSKTAKAIDVARDAHRKGLDWLDARKAVLKATPSSNAQYSPINMGFQVIGLLYGKGFAHTLCLTVNCGYDTDCTGATVGSILGILKGYSRLPKKWTEPLGEGLATNASWGGIRNVLEGPNPIPASLAELTDRTIAMAKKVMAGVETSKDALMADESVFELLSRQPMTVHTPSPEHDVTVDYGDDPVIAPGEAKVVRTIIGNPHPESRTVACTLTVPEGWSAKPASRRVTIPASGQAEVRWTVRAPAGRIANSNRLTLVIETDRRIAPPATPIVLIGARAMQVAGPYATDRKPGRWKTVYGRGNSLPSDALPGPGVVYIRQWLRLDRAETMHVNVIGDVPTEAWLDGEPIEEPEHLKGRLRPAMYAGKARRLAKGFHEILVKVRVGTKRKKPEIHVILDRGNRYTDGCVEACWTQLPQ